MDPYVYPGTNVLKNLREIQDLSRLAKFEMDVTTRRLSELEHKPLSGSFDDSHLRAIHRHIFQDVYPWAGEFRTVNISRSGQFPFAFPEHIGASVDRLSNGLAQERQLEGMDLASFCSRAAYYMGELNAIHPFRDGNGRTQREFIRELAVRNGFTVNWSRVTRAEMMGASQRSFQNGDNSGLEGVLRTASSQFSNL